MFKKYINFFRNEAGKTLKLGLPLIASNLVYASSGFMSTRFVAELGHDALAASVLVSSLLLMLTIFFFSILSAIAVLVAHEYGAKNQDGISRIMGQAYLLGGIIIGLMYLSLSAFPLLIQYSGQSEAIQNLAIQYVHGLYWMIPALVILLIAEHFLSGLGHGNLVLRISLAVVPIEIPLIYALVLGKWGFPACGVKGIGYGLCLTYTLAASLVTLYLCKSTRFKDYHLFRYTKKWDRRVLMEFVKLGLPFGLISIIEFSTFAVAAFLMGRFGAESLAAHQIVLQYLGVAIQFVIAMSQATSIRVGHALGEQDPLAKKRAAWSGMLVNLLFIIPISLAYILIPNWLIGIDLDLSDPNNTLIIKQSGVLLGISGILLFFDNFRIIGTGALRGLKDSQAPMYLSALGLWIVGLGSAYWLAIYLTLSGPGVWWGLTLGIAAGAGLILWRLRSVLSLGRCLTANQDNISQIDQEPHTLP